MENTNSSSMSEPGSLMNIFFEPGRTFESFRIKPRFILATILMILCSIGYQVALSKQLGPERMRRFMIEQMDKNPRAESMPKADKEKIIDQQLSFQWIGYVITPFFIIIFLLITALLIWLGIKAMGGEMSFLQALSVWIYASFPAAVITLLGSILVLFLKSPDDIDIATSNGGLLHANLGLLVDGKESPVLATLLSTFDVFSLWKWVLAAIGLAIVARASKGSAWAVVIMLLLIGLAIRVLFASLLGTPM